MQHARLLPLREVRLLEGPFARAQALAEAYLARLDADRLLAPYLREAGLPHAQPYPNWESEGLDGHIGGHYLSAVALMYSSSGDRRYRDHAAAFVEGLARAQDAVGTGYVGGIPGSESFWQLVSVGITTETFGARWVPWYNLHKMLAGLIEAYRSAEVDQALTVAQRFGDWWLEHARDTGDESFEVMLGTEYGGMNEAFADLGELTGRADFLHMARRFTHHDLADPLSMGLDRLEGLHANTQIQKVLGYQRVAALGGDEELRTAASTFWRTVVGHRSVSIGGNSVREHFHALDDFRPMVEDREGPETCNSYNMVRLGLQLFEASGDPSYLDHVERILHNHVLSAQHPEHGGFVYFTPMRPGHYRVYSQPDTSFWCCVGSGLEAHARHGAGIFAERDGAFLVNFFIAAEARSPIGLAGTWEVSSPSAGSLTLTSKQPPAVPIGFRIPTWAAAPPEIRVNGLLVGGTVDRGYVMLARKWRTGDRIDVQIAKALTAQRLPDQSAWTSYSYGPVVLAARAGDADMPDLLADSGRVSHIARGPLTPLATAPMVSGAPEDVTVSSDGFRLMTSSGPVRLEPFSEIHDARYTVYFPTTETDQARRRADLELLDEAALALDGRTLDHMLFGEQQPESDHRFIGPGAAKGRTDGRPWRRSDARMSLTLQDWRRLGRVIRIESIAEDGPIECEVRIDGTELDEHRAGVEGGIRFTEYSASEPNGDHHTVEILGRAPRTARLTAIRVLSR